MIDILQYSSHISRLLLPGRRDNYILDSIATSHLKKENENIFKKGIDKRKSMPYNVACVQRQQAVH